MLLMLPVGVYKLSECGLVLKKGNGRLMKGIALAYFSYIVVW